MRRTIPASSLSRAATALTGLVLTAALALPLGGCDFLRPAGKQKIEFDENVLVPIQEGWFVFGGMPQCHGDTTGEDCQLTVRNQFPWRLAYLTGYRIEKREVTNAEYLECVHAGECSYPNDGCWVDAQLVAEIAAGFFPLACRFTHNDVAREPIRGVSWEQARKYCKWRYKGKTNSVEADLPTEAQWERAAVGPAVGDLGDAPFAQPSLPMADPPGEPTCEHLIHGVGNDCTSDADNPDNRAYEGGDAHPFTVIDGDGEYRRTKYASVEGVIDLGGNVSEWVRDSSNTSGQYCGGEFLGATYPVTNECGTQEAIRSTWDGEEEIPEDWRPFYRCIENRQPDLNDVRAADICNPVVGISEDINLERVVKGGSYKSSKWCHLSPRAREFRSNDDPSQKIGFRCAVWDEKPEARDAICQGTLPAPPRTVLDAGMPIDAGSNDAATSPDAGVADAWADGAATEDAAGEDV